LEFRGLTSLAFYGRSAKTAASPGATTPLGAREPGRVGKPPILAQLGSDRDLFPRVLYNFVGTVACGDADSVVLVHEHNLKGSSV
jgi:hypothetical protein